MKESLNRIVADALAIKARQRQAVQEAARHIAAPGVVVEVIAKPWPVGLQGRVWGVYKEGAGWVADVALEGRTVRIPLAALARVGSDLDCATAQIRHSVAEIKAQGTEFLD